VIGIGLCGDELKHAPDISAPTYLKPYEAGFITTVHAGEAAGPSSIWSAIEPLILHRIGHGVRAIEDELLLEHLSIKQVPLEVCPLSNMRTKLFSVYQNHPVRKLFDRGIPISINTDDPALFQTSLSQEYEGLRHTHGFSDMELHQVILDSIQHSFASPDIKVKLIDQISSHPEWTNA